MWAWLASGIFPVIAIVYAVSRLSDVRAHQRAIAVIETPNSTAASLDRAVDVTIWIALAALALPVLIEIVLAILMVKRRAWARIGLMNLLVNTPEFADAWIENRDRRGVVVFAHRALFERVTDNWVSLPTLGQAQESLGIRLLRGRLLSGQDREDTLKVAVINESSTRYFFGERDPIGQTIEFPKKGAVAAVYRIVGVVGNSKHNDLREPSPRFVFIPIRQPLDAYRRLTLVVAPAAGKHAELLKGIRNRLATLDPELLISEVITIRRQLDSTLLTERLLSELSAVFGILALILASVGLHGVLSYRIGQQRQSIGIQMAPGASPSFVAFSVLLQGAAVIAAGIVCGMPFAFMAERTADSLLWGIKSSDPTTYLIGAAVLSLVGLVGALLPARRASAIEPAEALRHN